MNTPPISLIDKICGVPMISGSFNPQTLITLTAHYRHIALNAFTRIADYLSPDVIEAPLQQRNAALGIEYPEYAMLSAQEENAVNEAIRAIITIVPEWEIYFSLPVNYRKLSAGKNMVSLTNHHIPQVVFLGDKAFKSEHWLAEVLIHENAHVWLGMLCEMNHFYEASHEKYYTLPSGTKNKDARGVIFASHFAACTLLYYRRKKTNGCISPEEAERLSFLEKYYAGCMTQLKEMKELTETGKDIVRVMGVEIHHG